MISSIGISKFVLTSQKFTYGNLLNNFKSLSIMPRIPPSIIYEHHVTPDKTPAHHNNPDVENMLKNQLCNYPPYSSRKIYPGFQDALMIRDYKRRQIAFHFSDLCLRLNAIRKNTILPKQIQDMASLQIHSLPRDSHWTRIFSRCVATSRRRGCKIRWKLSRIMWRRYADYNRLSGTMWACWASTTYSERRHLRWPPPSHTDTTSYINLYHKNLADK